MKPITSGIKYTVAVLMAVLTALTFYQIVLRFVFNSPSSWSEEGARFIFIYVSFLGAGIGILEHTHIGIDIVVNMLSERWRRVVSIIVYGGMIWFGAMLIYASIPLLKLTSRQLSPALRIPMHYIYFAVVLFGILCVVYSIGEAIKLLRAKKQTDSTPANDQ